jgi:hypothetical protein
MIESGEIGRQKRWGLSLGDRPQEPKHDTRKKIAEKAGVSVGQVAMAEQVKKKAYHLVIDLQNQNPIPAESFPFSAELNKLAGCVFSRCAPGY